MAAAEAQLGRMERAPVAAARGMGMLQSGMRVLAFQATGLTGPLGAAASGLGMFALGGQLMLAVTAGLGAGALAARLFQKDLEELGRASHAIALDKAISSIHKAALGLSKTSLTSLNQDLERTKRAIHELTRGAVPAVGGGFILFGEKEQQLNQLLADRLAFQKAITEEQVKQRILTKELRIEMVAMMQGITAGLPSPRLILLNQLGGGALRGVSPQMAGIDSPARALQLRRIANESLGMELNKVSLDLKRKEQAAQEKMVTAVKGHADAINAASISTQQAAAALITGVGAMVQGVIGGGGGTVGSALGLFGGIVGGIVGMANPLIGTVLSTASGVAATLAARSRREPIPVYDAALYRELAALRSRQLGRERVIILRDPGTDDDVLYAIRKLEDLDAQPRVR